jgi:hypothetical protein
VITILWNWRSRSSGIGDHDSLELVITIAWNAQGDAQLASRLLNDDL